jgi:hypothetical protein
MPGVLSMYRQQTTKQLAPVILHFYILNKLSERHYVVVMTRINLRKIRIPARLPKMSKDPFIQGAGKIPKSACVVHSIPKCRLVRFARYQYVVTYKPPELAKPLQLTVYLHLQAPQDPGGTA